MTTLIKLIEFFTFKKLRIFYLQIADLFIVIMLKTKKFNILLHGEIVVGEVGCWGNCCWGSCLRKVVTGEVALGNDLTPLQGIQGCHSSECDENVA